MTVTFSRIGFVGLTILGFGGGCARERGRSPGTSTAPDSAAAAISALDTLRRLGARDYVVDSLVRRADTATVWAGPRVWMATDRPTSAVSVVAPARIVGIRQILGG
jgi:hypothetical protein